MFCPNCGTENPDDSRFCGHCGTNVATQLPASEPNPPEIIQLVDLDAPMTRVSGGLKYGVLAASLLMPFLGVGMGLYYWIKGESDEKTAVGRLWFFVGLGLAIVYGMLTGDGAF